MLHPNKDYNTFIIALSAAVERIAQLALRLSFKKISCRGLAIMEIMIIDDDDDDLRLYGELFESIDNNVHTMIFNDAAKALSHLRHSSPHPDLIILDFNMPRMNGVDFLRLLRADPSLSHLRVTVITTSCSGRDRQYLVSLDAECHEKLSTFKEFKALLRRLIVHS